MSYISEIFERANFQQIRSFLLDGVESMQTSPQTYQARLETAFECIETNLPDLCKDDDAINPILEYSSANHDVYMEIGLQCGFILAMDLMYNRNREIEEKK